MAESALDLRAVEIFLLPSTEWEDKDRAMWALITHCRALIEVVKDGQAVVISLAQPENISRKPWLGEMARAFLGRAAAVLALARDEEAPGETQP